MEEKVEKENDKEQLKRLLVRGNSGLSVSETFNKLTEVFS